MTSHLHRPPSVRQPVPLAGVVFAVLVGLLLLHYYSSLFVFDHADAYQGSGSCIVLVCSP